MNTEQKHKPHYHIFLIPKRADSAIPIYHEKRIVGQCLRRRTLLEYFVQHSTG